MEGRHARTVDLSPENLEACWGIEDATESTSVSVVRFPEDLRRIAGGVEVLKVKSEQLRALPEWIGELENLKSLALGHCSETICSIFICFDLMTLT